MRLVAGPRQSMIEAPTDGRTLLPQAAARERLLHGLAYALNTDEEAFSPSGYGLFPDELSELHSRICGAFWNLDRSRAIVEAIAFAARWRLRRRDVWDTCRLIEMHGQPGDPQEGSMVLRLPLVAYDRPAGLQPAQITSAEPLIYDPFNTTEEEIARELETRQELERRALRAAKAEWIQRGALVRVAAQHADPQAVIALAQRWVRVIKGWSLRDIADADRVSVPAVQSSLRIWRDLDATRLIDDARFRDRE